MKTYKIETDEGLALEVELLGEMGEDGHRYRDWVIFVQPMSGYTVFDCDIHILSKCVRLLVTTSITEEEAQ